MSESAKKWWYGGGGTPMFLIKWHMQTADPDQTASGLIRVHAVCHFTSVF